MHTGVNDTTIENTIDESFANVVQDVVSGFPSSFLDIHDFALPFKEGANNLSSWAQHYSTTVDQFLRSDNLSSKALRTERDLWTLLEMLSHGNVLGKIENKIPPILDLRSNLQTTDTIADCVNTVFSLSNILKKGEILKQWLERSAQDEICIPSRQADHISNDELFSELIDFTSPQSCRGELKDYEVFLKCVWQYVRSGQLQQAQQLAFDHRVFWIASLLRGVDDCYYSELSNGDVAMVTRIGNVRQPVWSLSCWKYADALTKANISSSEVSKLELVIYSALSNNVPALIRSSLSLTWHDKTWAFVKAAHTRNLTRVLAEFRQMKARNSEYFLSVQRDVLEAEKELLGYLENSVGDIALGNCSDIFRANPTPTSRNVEALLINLQAIFMSGYVGVQHFMSHELGDVLDHIDQYPGRNDVLRILVHILLWVRSAPEGFADSISDLVDVELFFSVLELYIDSLIDSGHFGLVTTYCMFLSRPRRVKKFCDLLLVVQDKVLNKAISEVMFGRITNQAQTHFGEEDVKESFCIAIEQTRRSSDRSYFALTDKSQSMKDLWTTCQNDLDYDDMLQLLCLQWFRNDPVNWILHSNRVITGMLEEHGFSKILFVSTLLDLIWKDENNACDDTSEISMKIFENSKLKVAFWQSLCSAGNLIKLWYGQRDRCKLIRKDAYKSNIENEVSTLRNMSYNLLDALEKCLKFNESEGFVSMWRASKDYTCEVVKVQIEKLLSLESTRNSDSPEMVAYDNHIKSMKDSCVRLLQASIVSTVQFEDIISNIEIAATRKFGCRSTLFSAEIILHECNSLLNNLFHEESFSKCCLFVLLKTYLEVIYLSIYLLAKLR